MYVFIIFLQILSICILHEIYVMAASTYKSKIDVKNKIIFGLKEASLLNKTGISFFWITRIEIDLESTWM